jgi:protein-disulfide isomerase
MLKSSAFLSLILAFLVFLGGNQPLQTVQTPDRPIFSNIIELSEMDAAPPGPVAIRVYDKFRCKSCDSLALGTLPELKKLYVDPGKAELNIIMMPNPADEFDERARMSLKCAAEQKKFWEMYNAIHNEEEWTKFTFEQLAIDLGLNIKDYHACKDENRYSEEMNMEADLASKNQVTSAPVIDIRNYRLIGDQPIENIVRIIKKYLKTDELKIKD